MPGFGATLATTPEEIAVTDQVVAEAFAAWESPSLGFDVRLEDPGGTGLAGPAPATGFDIDGFLVPGSHPAYAPPVPAEAFGVTHMCLDSSTPRPAAAATPHPRLTLRPSGTSDRVGGTPPARRSVRKRRATPRDRAIRRVPDARYRARVYASGAGRPPLPSPS